MQIPKAKAVKLYSQGFTITVLVGGESDGIEWQPEKGGSLQIILDKYYTTQEKEGVRFYVATARHGSDL